MCDEPWKFFAYSAVLHDVSYSFASTTAEHKLYFQSTKDTPYLALTGELWDVFREHLWEN